MDLSLGLQLIASGGVIISSVIGLWKFRSEFLKSPKISLREDYCFARDFFRDLRSGSLDPVVSEIGYQAIAGSSEITSDEVAYILGFNNFKKSIGFYMGARILLDFYSTALNGKIKFKKFYRSKKIRNSLKGIYILGYFLFYGFGVLPIFMVIFKQLPPSTGIWYFVVSGIIFLPLAYVSLKAGGRIARAEKLMQIQAESKVKIA